MFFCNSYVKLPEGKARNSGLINICNSQVACVDALLWFTNAIDMEHIFTGIYRNSCLFVRTLSAQNGLSSKCFHLYIVIHEPSNDSYSILEWILTVYVTVFRTYPHRT